MASATDIANPEAAGGALGAGPPADAGASYRSGHASAPDRHLDLIGLAILIGGALVLNRAASGLINASRREPHPAGRADRPNVIDQLADGRRPGAGADADTASDVLFSLFIPHSQRARLFGCQGRLLADSYLVADRVEVRRCADQETRRLSFSFGPTIRARRAAARRQGGARPRGQSGRSPGRGSARSA